MQPQRNGDAADEGGVVLADQDHGRYPLLVMAGLDPAIHVFVSLQSKEDVDHRVKPGDDDWSMTPKRAYPSPSSLASNPFTARAHPASFRSRVAADIAGLNRRSSRELSANFAGSG